jgi:hypothetical protein
MSSFCAICLAENLGEQTQDLRGKPLDQLLLLDARNHLEPPAAAHTLLDLDPEQLSDYFAAVAVVGASPGKAKPGGTFVQGKPFSARS